MAVIDLVLALVAGEHDLFGVDDDDVVSAIDMRRVDGLVLALEAGGDQGREATDDEAFGINHDPLLLHRAGFATNVDICSAVPWASQPVAGVAIALGSRLLGRTGDAEHVRRRYKGVKLDVIKMSFPAINVI